MKLQYQLSNGMWTDATDQFIDWVLPRAVAHQALIAKNMTTAPLVETAQDVLDVLATGRTLSHGSDWYQNLRDADALAVPTAVLQVLCQCGHYTDSPMNSSFGSSCPSCYDDMSG